MSYPGYPNYDTYYGAAQNEQTSQSSHGSARSTVPPSSYPDPVAYITEARQANYASQECRWPTAIQQSYSSNNKAQGQDAGDPFRDSTSGQMYNDQRAHASHVGSNKRQTEMQAHSDNASHAPKQPSTKAPNELAHASGLEFSGIESTSSSRTAQPPQRNCTPNNTAVTQPRIQNATLQQGSSNQSHPSPYGSQNSYQTNEQSHLALQAAAALHGLPNNSRIKAASPAINNAPTASAPSQQRPQSPYTATQNVASHQGNQTSQSRSNQQASGTARASTSSVIAQSSAIRPQQSHSVTPNDSSPAAQTNSIASLVTNDDRQASPAYPSPTEQQTSTTFINPREVFNPYHREHERVRREAAAAAAAAKREAAEEVLKAKSAPPEEPGTGSHPNNTRHEAPTKAAKPKPNSTGKAQASEPGPARETAEEAELRQLLARMKQLRGKDAALFQRVWDEEKGASAAKVPCASPMVSQEALPSYAQALAQVSSSVQRPSTASRQRDPDTPRGFNGYGVVVKDNEDDLPDLAMFPAARRVGYSSNGRKQQVSPARMPHQPTPTPFPAPAPARAAQAMTQPVPLVFNPNVTPDVPKVQPLTARGKDGTTVWPEASRKVLAAQAIKFLKSDPRHESLSISEADFFEMLDGNPSYVALCQLIEARGFTFDRAHFARNLIVNVPGLSNSKQASQLPLSPALPQTQAQAQGQVLTPAPAIFNPPAANHAPPFMNGSFVKSGTGWQHFKAASPLMHQRNAPLAALARSLLSVPATQVPAPTPGSKEDMARKRGFEDLIDLTNEDDEDYVVPEKRLRVRSPSPEPITAFAQQSQPRAQPQSSFVRFGSPTPQGMLPKAVAPLRIDTYALGSFREELKQSRLPKVMLARKLNKAEALRRNYYDPKTVARDILISTGRHPTERPLNGHLATLLGNHIELDSDLSTFHWEDIDPGGPPAPKTAWTDIPTGPPRFKSRKSDSKDPTDARRKALQSSAESPLGRVLPDLTHGVAGRGHVNAGNKYAGRFEWGKFMSQEHQGPPPSKKGQMPRSLASIKTRDSSPQAARHAEDNLRTLAQQTKSLLNDSFRPPSALRHSQAVASGAETQSSQANSPKKRAPGHPLRKSNFLDSSPPAPTPGPPPAEPPKRRGSGGPPRSTTSPQIQISPLRPTGSVRSSQRSVSIEIPKTEGSFRPNGKRIGRPPEEKNKIPSGERKAAGMSLEVVVPRLRAQDEPPEYPVFKCRWFQCGVELHNISTLRKHIIKLHKPSQEIADAAGYGCYWKKCSLLRRDDDGKLQPTPMDTEEEWLEHVNEDHIYPLGQKHGDGPSTAHIGKQSQPFKAIVSKYFYNPSQFPTDARISSHTDPQAVAYDRRVYLADEKGRNTTRLIHSEDEPDAVILTDFYTQDTEANKAAEMAFKSFLGNHGHTKQDMRAAADETFKAMAVRKERAGVGIDRGGCTLVNEERRKTFVQNPDISRVVDFDY